MDKTMTEFWVDAAIKKDITFDNAIKINIINIKEKMIKLNLSHKKAFVAFMDISGFKKYLEEGKAEEVIDDFYSIGSKAILDYNKKVDLCNQVIYDSFYKPVASFCELSKNIESNVDIKEMIAYITPSIPLKLHGVFISDCIIVYFEDDFRCQEDHLWALDLDELFKIIKEINIEMLKKDHLISCSIAYGDFQFIQKQDHDEIKQNAIIGNGYVEAYYDNEYGIPNIQPGECRFVLKTLHEYTEAELQGLGYGVMPTEAWRNFHLDKYRSPNGAHLYFLWMLEDNSKLSLLEKRLLNEKQLVYENIKQVFRDALQGNWDKFD